MAPDNGMMGPTPSTAPTQNPEGPPAAAAPIPEEQGKPEQHKPPTSDEEQARYNDKCKTMRIKIYGYYNKLPEMMSLVTFPTPITSIMHYNFEQLEELYNSIVESRDAHSVTGGALAHNALTNFVEIMGVNQGFYLNGFAQEVAIEAEAQNLKLRLGQLVKILEIEYGFGIRHPLAEYALLMGGIAARRHMMLANSDRSLFVTAAQFEPVPSDVQNDFSHL